MSAKHTKVDHTLTITLCLYDFLRVFFGFRHYVVILTRDVPDLIT